MKTSFLLLIFTLLSIKAFSQDLEYRSVDYYFDMVAKREIDEMRKEGLLDDSLNVAKKYRELGKESFNEEAAGKYYEIKAKVMQSIFKDYLFQQFVEYNNDVYVLYFSIAGFDDTEWQVLRWNKSDWDRKDKIDLQLVEGAKLAYETKEKTYKYKFQPIVFNYDEGPKNVEDVRIFIKYDYLIMERGHLYHSLYDLKHKKVIVNEESPWNASDGKGKEEMNKWIKANLHDKIAKIINN